MKWLMNAAQHQVQYQRGFFATLRADVKRYKIFYLKLLSLIVVVSFTVVAVSVDFEVVEGYRNYGIKAATCAMGAAAVVLIGLIPTTTLTRPFFNPFVHTVGGMLAFSAGVFWLLSETSGSVGPYLVIIVVNGFAMFAAAGASWFAAFVYRVESTYLQRRERDGETADC